MRRSNKPEIFFISSHPPGDADGPLEERPVGEDAVLHVDLELELAVLHPQEEAGAAAEVQVGAALKTGKKFRIFVILSLSHRLADNAL